MGVPRPMQVWFLGCCLALASGLPGRMLWAQRAVYTFTSGPNGDGFVWDADEPPVGLNDLPTDETFFAPDEMGGVISFENYSGNVSFFDANYEAAQTSALINGAAWWGNPDDSGGGAGLSFVNTSDGVAQTIQFDFAWALPGENISDFLGIELIDPDGDIEYFETPLDRTFIAGGAFGGGQGREGTIFINADDFINQQNSFDGIEGIYIPMYGASSVEENGEFAIDNLRINAGSGDPGDSNVYPGSIESSVSGIYTNRLKDSFDTTVFFEVANDGTGDTTFTATLDGTSDPEFILDAPATNEPIAAGEEKDTGPVASLSSALPSGLYQSSVTITNDLNEFDPSESVTYDVTIYDPPDLTDNSDATVQVDADPGIFVANAAAGPHAGAIRADVEVIGTSYAGPFSVNGFDIGDFIMPGDTQNGTVGFDRFGLRTGAYQGVFTVDMEMNSAADGFLNGREPVPSVDWDLVYDLAEVNVDSADVDSTEDYHKKVGVNNLSTAATLIDGTSPDSQTVDMQFTSNPEDGGPRTASEVTDLLDLGFSAASGQYVLQFTHDNGNVPPGSAEEDLRLLFFDTFESEWVDAINGNSDGGLGGSFFSGSYEDYLATSGGGVLDSADLSFYGVDADNDHVWAVLDHSALFMVGLLPIEWIAPDGGAWSSGANWLGGVPPDGGALRALFGGEIEYPASVIVDGDFTVTGIKFDNGAADYTLAGDGVHAITLAADATIEVAAGSHAISAPLAGDHLMKSGPGTLTLTGANSYTGMTSVYEGTLVVENQELPGHGTEVAAGAVLRLNQFVTYELLPGQSLSGSGDVILSHTFSSTELVIPETGTLLGSLRIEADAVVNFGRIAPGFSPDIIEIDGDLILESSSVLEIEVGGLTPGAEHDQLIVSGSADLNGRLEVPIIDNFMPAENDEIVFLTAADVSNQFDSVFSPNLASIAPNLAIDVEENDTDVRLRFVVPSSSIQFDSQTSSADWADASTWTSGNVPGTTHVIEVMNLVGTPQRVEVVSGNAFTHQLSVIGGSSTTTVSVQDGFSLSATAGAVVGNQGVVELADGTLVSTTTAVQDGGMLTGNGMVVGDLVVGGGGGDDGMVSPGFSVGSIDVEGSYRQMTDGTLQIEVEGTEEGQFDTLQVTGEAELGGTLMIDATNLPPVAPGTSVDVLTAGSLVEGTRFDEIETMGNPDIYFAPTYETTAVSMSIFLEGDMNRDTVLDQQDVAALALALSMPFTYEDTYFITGAQSGDVDDNGRLDFDDIDDFATLIPGASVGSILEAIRNYRPQVPEPSTACLAMLCFVPIICARRRCGFTT